MLLNFHLPSYFSRNVRREISELYAHSAIVNMASSMMLLFEPIFLYAVLGFSVNQVLLFTAIVYAVYIVCIPWGGKMASMYGYKHAIAMSVPFQIIYWAMLIASQQNASLAFAAGIFYGLSKSLYWPGFHSLMARYADQGQVGREFSVVYALISITHIVGPFFAGWISQHYGFTASFLTVSILQGASLLPLFKAKEIFIPKVYKYSQTLELYRTYPRKFFGYLGFGEEMLVLNIWPVFIYIVVRNYQEAGLLATGASLLAALLALIVGKVTDQYSKRILIKLGAFFTSLVWAFRYLATSASSVFAVDAFSRTSKEMAFIPISTVTYIRAENTHVVPYVVFFEQSLAIGKLIACILGIAVFALTGSFVALFILGALFSLLYMLI